MTSDRGLQLYLVLVFAVSYAWQFVIYLTGSPASPWFPVLMVFPALSALTARLKTREGFRSVGWGLRRWWYAIPALLVPLLVVLGVGTLLTSLGWAALAGRQFVFTDGVVDIPKVPLALGNHTQGLAFFAVNLAVSLFGVSLLGSVFTFGEEFGWQGYLLPKLLGRFGLNRGFLLLGLIWGYWHLPVILMGYNFPNHPVLGALVLMPLRTIGLGVFEGWLYLRSRSIWMPVLAHASGNTVAALLFTELTMHRDELWRQLAWIGAWGIVAAVCLVALNRSKRNPDQSAALMISKPRVWVAGPSRPSSRSPACDFPQFSAAARSERQLS